MENNNNYLLYKKIFNNIVISKIIFKYVQRNKNENIVDGYKTFDFYSLGSILKNKKLFNLRYQSFIYYSKYIKDQDKSFSIFHELTNYSNTKLLFESDIVDIEKLSILFNEYHKYIFNNLTKDQVLEYAISSLEKSKVEFLIHSYGFKFDDNLFNQFVSSICNKKNSTLEYLNYVLELFKKYPLYQTKKESEEFYLSTDSLYNIIRLNKFDFYEPIFKICKGYFDQYPLKDEGVKSAHNKFITHVVDYNSNEMAEIYCKYYKNKKPAGQEKIRFLNSHNKSIKPYLTFIKGGVLKPLHYPYSSFEFMSYSTLEEFLPLMETIRSRFLNRSLVLSRVADTETLKYILKEQYSFQPPIIFDRTGLLSWASVNKDYNLVLFLTKELNVKPENDDSFRNTSFKIFKYFYDNYPFYQFNDITFDVAYNNDIEFCKFAVEEFKRQNKRISLSYRSLDRVVEKGYLELSKYLLYEIGYLGISRDLINYSIKTDNLELIDLFKNVRVTKHAEVETIYDSTREYIKASKKRHDILELLKKSIYKKNIENEIN